MEILDFVYNGYPSIKFGYHKNQDDIWIKVIRIIDIQIKFGIANTVNIYKDLFQESVIYSRTPFIGEAIRRPLLIWRPLLKTAWSYLYL